MKIKIKIKEFNIAAVSLIEILMIFAIIGIVTTACMGLSKPKMEYTTKLKLYSALEALEYAGKFIASEGHIDFTTDVNTCTSRKANNVCNDYNKKRYPNKNNLLPKTSQRAASTNKAVDPGLTSNTVYSNLTATEKAQFKYLQDGLCQRLAKAFNLPPANINCGDDITSASASNPPLAEGIFDNRRARNYFYNKRPQLFLANGQVIYIAKHLYNDYIKGNNELSHNIVYSNNGTYETSYMGYAGTKLESVIGNLYSNSNGDYLLNTPTETRLAIIKKYKESANYTDDTRTIKLFVNYLEKAWSQSKDYFIIYVDINCKMTSYTDKKCGPDTLGVDVFAFKMYRDGTVLPGQAFPERWLNAKILAKDTSTTRPTYNDRVIDVTYAMKSITASRCYANLVGDYYAGYTFDSSLMDRMGICSTTGSNSIRYYPLAECIAEDGESNCKSIVNKPSFLMR